MCKFFKRDPKDTTTPIKLAGLQKHIHLHQAIAITWKIEQVHKFSGAFIRDEQGLGKTVLYYAHAFIDALCEVNYSDVEKCRERGEKTHLTSGETGSCPLAAKWQLQCACEADSLLAEVGPRSIGPKARRMLDHHHRSGATS